MYGDMNPLLRGLGFRVQGLGFRGQKGKNNNTAVPREVHEIRKLPGLFSKFYI